ncbi:MAG: xanthine dehydrogenase family protein subunit M [Spirochaetes bacterium]|nr:xanthine dehydrogenase family protein subunit M [Spirochaetota bacterium]
MDNFKYFKPQNFKELLNVKYDLSSAGFPLAGGSNLLIYIKEKSIRSGTLIDITSLKELRGIKKTGDTIEIGAAETISGILESKVLENELPFFSVSMRDFANPLIRNKATIGGNMADASPVADTAPPLLVLDAKVVAASKSGIREIPANEFFSGPGKNNLSKDEIIQKINIPVPERGSGIFLKLGQRKGTSISVTSVAVWIVNDSNKITGIRISLGGVAPVPIRAVNAEKAFSGKIIDENNITALAETLKEDIKPISDLRGSAEYRTAVSINLLKRAILTCLKTEE